MKLTLYKRGKGGLIDGKGFNEGGLVPNSKKDNIFINAVFAILADKLNNNAETDE